MFKTPSSRWLHLLVVAMTLPSFSPLHAAPPDSVTTDGTTTDESTLWQRHWRTSDWRDAVSIGVVGGGAAALELLVDPPSVPRWTGPVLFDKPIRSALKVMSAEGREDAALVSDVTWYTTMAYPLVDTLLTALVVHDDPDTAWEMTVMVGQAYAFTGFLSALFVATAGRARPFAGECEADPLVSPLCGTPEENRSFASGHSSFAFTGAGLTCAFHGAMDLYGDGPWGSVACVGTLVGATTTAVLRLVSDRHWTTDVLVGSGIGFAAGYLVPTLLHFTGDEGPADVVISPWSHGDTLGVGLSGRF